MSNARMEDRVLLVGASRGLGLALAEQWLSRGRRVVATMRGDGRSRLHDLRDASDGRLEVERVDIDAPDETAALHARLAGRVFDLLFVNAGVANDDRDTIATVSTDEYVRVMVTNALSPLRFVEAFRDLVAPRGTIGVMSSGQGSVANNEAGGHEVYRSSKAALNMSMRSLAARYAGDPRTLVLAAPGWVRTDLGGPDARLGIDESIPKLVDVIAALDGRGGLHYVDYLGRTVPW